MFTIVKLPPEIIRYDDGQRCLVMRRSLMEDVPLLAEGVQDSLSELRRFMPWAHFTNTLDSQSSRCQGLIESWDKGQEFCFNLFLCQTDGTSRFVGCIGLHPRCLTSHGLEIGYWVRSDTAGKGICTLAVQMLTLAGFQVMGLKRLQVGCDIMNIGSRRVIEKTGFHHEGIQRNMGEVNPPPEVIKNGWLGSGDHHCYALIPEDLTKLNWVKKIERYVQFESL